MALLCASAPECNLDKNRSESIERRHRFAHRGYVAGMQRRAAVFRVTALELFFDLVFVFAIMQVTGFRSAALAARDSH